MVKLDKITFNNKSESQEYTEALDYIYSLGQFNIKLGLERINSLMEKTNHPERNFKVIHVTGTNGKGSVCEMITNILINAGYTVGTYNSPHLTNFTERIRINKKEISEKNIARLTKMLKPIAGEATFFEFVTAMALVYFNEQKIDIAVIEVGLGGRLDATNVCDGIVNVITNIALEHTQQLGNSLISIAQEKSGIIKPNSFVVTGCIGRPLKVIKEKCQAVGANLVELVFKKRYQLSLLGEFQHNNARIAETAVRALEKFNKRQFLISDKNIIEGIKNTAWPGRLEFVRHNVLLDCAHNPNGISTLIKELNLMNYKNIVLIFGVMKDKGYKKMLSLLLPKVKFVIAVKADNNRALEPEKIITIIKQHKKECVAENSIKKAIDYSLKIPHDLILITGSIYVIGEARPYFLDQSTDK